MDIYKDSSSHWAEKFRNHDYSLTKPRKAVLDVLNQTSGHLSVEDIYLAVHKSYPAIGLTTVYRTLDLLVQMGLVLKFDFGDGKTRYELIHERQEELHHHHLVCKGCGRIINYTDFLDEEMKLIEKTEKKLSNKYDFKIDRHIIQFYGYCKECREEN